MRDRNKYDLNTLFQIGNFCTCIIAITLYYNVGGNDYVDLNTLCLLWLLGGQNILMLWYEKRKRDPFILILVGMTLVFYMVRIVTLLYIPWSLALNRYPITPNDLNYSLQFIFFSNAVIFLGLIAVRGKIIFREIGYIEEKPANPFLIIMVLLFLIIFNYFVLMRLEFLGRIASYLSGIFLNVYVLILLTVLYLIINFSKIARVHKNILIIVVAFYIISMTLIGSRAALLVLLQLTFFGCLSVKGRIMLDTKFILIGIALAILSTFIFVAATYIRTVGYDPKTFISMQRLDAAKEYSAYTEGDVELLLRPIFDRMGYLGYATDLITNNEEYSKIINPTYYLKSIIDNGLTPGFDIFDVPRASNALRYIYTGLSDRPTHEDITEEYSSEMFSLYGEYYILFGGYPALIFIFIFSYMFKSVYLRVKNKDVFSFYLYRTLILLIFHNWLISYGMDWMVIELIAIFITLFLFKDLYKMRRRKKNAMAFC